MHVFLGHAQFHFDDLNRLLTLRHCNPELNLLFNFAVLGPREPGSAVVVKQIFLDAEDARWLLATHDDLLTLRHGLDPDTLKLTDVELIGAAQIVIVEHINASHLHSFSVD